jgi:hypothetical protein
MQRGHLHTIPSPRRVQGFPLEQDVRRNGIAVELMAGRAECVDDERT